MSRQHTSAYVSIRQHTTEADTFQCLRPSVCRINASMSSQCGAKPCIRHTSSYVSIRQHSSEFVSIRVRGNALPAFGCQVNVYICVVHPHTHKERGRERKRERERHTHTHTYICIYLKGPGSLWCYVHIRTRIQASVCIR